MPSSNATPLLHHEVRNHIAFITLNRPQALNAVNNELLQLLLPVLLQAQQSPDIRAVVMRGAGDKAFCAGGDIRELYRTATQHLGDPMDFFHTEYAINHLLHHLHKPYLAWMDGVVMGGGMGLAQGASYRIVTERSRLAMPETAIGYFPDVGGSYFLSHLPGAWGEYLAITGASIDGWDAIDLGWADIMLPSTSATDVWSALHDMPWPQQRANDPRAQQRDAMALANCIARVAQQHPPVQRPAQTAAFSERTQWVAEHFQASTILDIEAALERSSQTPPSNKQAWAHAAWDILQRHSPLAMAMSLCLIRLGRQQTLAQCLALETYLDHQWLSLGNLLEGVRALLVDKDKSPRWEPKHLSDITPELLLSFLPPGTLLPEK